MTPINTFRMNSYMPTKLIIILCSALVAVPLFVSANIMSPLPKIMESQAHQLKLIGQTRFKKFGFHIYDASFWMQNNEEGKELCTNFCALSITYARNIEAIRLLESTEKEWKRLGFHKKYPVKTWLDSLDEIWPDVQSGDQLVVMTSPSGKTVFYNKDARLGELNDPEFGPAFLAIWLDEKSRYSKNRKELLGDYSR